MKTGDENQIGVLWVAVGEDAVTLLDLETMSPLVRHPYSEVVTFGGCQDDLMLVVNPHQKHLFSLSKPKVRIAPTALLLLPTARGVFVSIRAFIFFCSFHFLFKDFTIDSAHCRLHERSRKVAGNSSNGFVIP